MRYRSSPSEEQSHCSDGLLRGRFGRITRSDHPLVRLGDVMPWEDIVEQVADLLPRTPVGAEQASLPVRMMVGLLYLKYADDFSEDQVIERWLESPYMQDATGQVYFQHELPCDPLLAPSVRVPKEGAELFLDSFHAAMPRSGRY